MLLEKAPCVSRCSLGSASILAVDDSNLTTVLIEKILRAAGIVNVRSAASVKQAASMLLTNDIDMIISDYRMDAIDGLAFLKLVRSASSSDAAISKKLESYKDIPFLMLTAYTTADVIDRAMEAGATAVMTKPIKPNVLLAHVKRALGVSCAESCFQKL